MLHCVDGVFSLVRDVRSMPEVVVSLMNKKLLCRVGGVFRKPLETFYMICFVFFFKQHLKKVVYSI